MRLCAFVMVKELVGFDFRRFFEFVPQYPPYAVGELDVKTLRSAICIEIKVLNARH